ncbi:phage tail sheath subtilisin-like domain-containing protein [Petroclostridium sp. X23]|uniref:phage tail sheath subtilisin-like domain-containing protein n=1 Tax=Petroclostridium sp. X23 TaxID=3045146 RepID=UPI0024ADA71B|nr:phage tail sheath subtilisin-like domain-containing protein [Petroclostridium sp. X23]WHH58310.1 phage tail sheath subtilisin-like domain-containing protein [Petroclostridium sp. X23]
MGGFFTVGEQKIRPGAYIRYENTGAPAEGIVPAGACAAVFKADWGPLGVSKSILTPTEAEKYYGSVGTNNNMDVITEELANCEEVIAIRLGSGGTKGTYAIKDTATTPATVINAVAKYPGTRAISLTIKDSLTDATMREFIVYEGTKERQKITFSKGSGEVDALIAAWTEAGSDWVDLTKVAAGNGTLQTLSQQALAGGANPTITNSDYSAAFSVIEALNWDAIAIDTEDTTIHALLQGFVSRVFREGKLIRGVVGEKTTVPLATRMTNAASFNDFCMHYCLNGWYDAAGNKYEGYRTAARIAGIIAAAPANWSLTHYVITGATALTETLTNPQIESALQKGALVFTTSPQGQVWIEYGINTLVTLTADQDAGWKKIRRVSTRFELMKRIATTVDPLIGKVDNSPDGRATIIAAAQGIINKMASEGKLLEGGTITEDPDNAPAGDSAWFKIAVDDLDSGEKLYFAYGFRFAPEA